MLTLQMIAAVEDFRRRGAIADALDVIVDVFGPRATVGHLEY
jgi:hypothetical protein